VPCALRAVLFALCQDSPPPEISPLSLHDALPISGREGYAQTKSGSGLPGAVVAEGCVTAPDTAGIDEQGAADDSTWQAAAGFGLDRKSTRLNSSHVKISYAVFRLKKKRRTRHSPA